MYCTYINMLPMWRNNWVDNEMVTHLSRWMALWQCKLWDELQFNTTGTQSISTVDVHHFAEYSRGCFKIKRPSYQYVNSRYKDKTISHSFYFYNGNPIPWNLYMETAPHFFPEPRNVPTCVILLLPSVWLQNWNYKHWNQRMNSIYMIN